MVALSAAAGTLAQDAGNATSFADGLLSALRANNLTALADAVGNNSASLLGALQGGNKTVLAPTDAAFQALGGDVDTDTLVATIAYHVLNGTYLNSQLAATNKTIAPTALNMSQFVMLPANRSQVAVLSRQQENNTAYVQLASGNVSFALTADGPQYQNLIVQPINTVLTIPGSTSDVAGQLGASSLAQLLDSADLVEPLDNSMVTVFAPNNAAIEAVMSTIQGADAAAQQAVLLNHVINGTVVYSTALGSTPSATSASGNMLTFVSNSTGAFVTSGSVTARIIMSDYAASNGVVHVIDQVLLNTTNNPEAAGSAFSSATANAATMTSAAGTGAQPTSGSGSGNGASSLFTATTGITAVCAALLGSGLYLVV